MVPGRQYSRHYVMDLIRRRGLYAAVPVVVILSLGIAIARSWPNLYYAQGTVSVLRPQVPETLVRSTVNAPFAERLRQTSETLRSPARLEALIREFDLYPDMRRTVPMDAVVAWMARSIRIEQVRPDMVVVGYSAYDRSKVAPVAERLTQSFIDQSLAQREVLADTTSQFLDAQVAAARQRLVEQEQRVQRYREQYAGELPTQVGANLQILQGAYTQLRTVMEELRQDRERRSQLQESASAAADAADRSPDAPAAGADDKGDKADPAAAPPPGPIDQRLRAARTSLAALRQRYTPEHPDVIRLQTVVDELEAAAKQAPPPAPRTDTAAAAPRVSESDVRAQRVEAELKRLDERIAEREAQEQQVRDTIATYQSRVEAVPRRESEWADLTRDYGTLEQGYSALLAKNQESRLAVNLERQRFGEQLKLADRPVPPTRPISPNRPRLVFISLMLGVFVGAGILVLFELLDTGLRAEDEVVTALAVPVLAMVPRVCTAQERRRGYLRTAVAAAALLLLVIAAMWRSV